MMPEYLPTRICLPIVLLVATTVLLGASSAREPDALLDVWPTMAPGESTKSPGERLPKRLNENPPATRLTKITRPQIAVYKPQSPNGTSILVLPGGGYNYVVTDKEGSEAASWLNGHGVTLFVLHYRTKDDSKAAVWKRPLQDGQRAMRLIRSRAVELGIARDRIGVLGFSAGGQLAALMATRFDEDAYQSIDQIDQASCRADFAMLIYPWKLVDRSGTLIPEITISSATPPSFLVHAHDDSATSLSSIEFYRALRRNSVPAELHIFQAGGHGYGMRRVAGTNIHTWPDRATEWLAQRNLIDL